MTVSRLIYWLSVAGINKVSLISQRTVKLSATLDNILLNSSFEIHGKPDRTHLLFPNSVASLRCLTSFPSPTRSENATLPLVRIESSTFESPPWKKLPYKTIEILYGFIWRTIEFNGKPCHFMVNHIDLYGSVWSTIRLYG